MEWIERYSTRIEEHRQPKSESQRLQLAQTYGEDGMRMLSCVFETARKSVVACRACSRNAASCLGATILPV